MSAFVGIIIKKYVRVTDFFPWLALILFSCASSSTDSQGSGDPNCSLSESEWIPSIAGLSASNHDPGAISIVPQTFSGQAPVVGLDQSYSNGQLITVNFSVASSLGRNGSVTFVGETTSFPDELSGSAYPVLISLENLTAGGGDMVALSAGCATNGIFKCTNGSCAAENTCTVGATSIYKSRNHWQQYQVPPFGENSMNVIPTCNWDNAAFPSFECEFNNSFFDNGNTPADATLKTGSYRAKFLMVASSYASLPSTTANFRITVSQKTDNRLIADYADASNGAIDLNVILVGAKNVADSKTTKGKANLDALFKRVFAHYNQDGVFPLRAPATTVYGGVGIELGEINVFEMGCEDDSDLEYFSNVPASELGVLFRVGSADIPSSLEGKALNIFINSFIENDITSSGTILGVSGSIGGTILNGTEGSGLVFRSGEQLATFNPACAASATSCADSDHEADFVDMAGTISHEIGHYLGLNHLTESNAAASDPLADTPVCTASGGTVTKSSCLTGGTDCNTDCPGYNGSTTFCETAESCQFNHIMWYTTKAYNEGTNQGDEFMFSDHSSRILNYSPFLR